MISNAKLKVDSNISYIWTRLNEDYGDSLYKECLVEIFSYLDKKSGDIVNNINIFRVPKFLTINLDGDMYFDLKAWAKLLYLLQAELENWDVFRGSMDLGKTEVLVKHIISYLLFNNQYSNIFQYGIFSINEEIEINSLSTVSIKEIISSADDKIDKKYDYVAVPYLRILFRYLSDMGNIRTGNFKADKHLKDLYKTFKIHNIPNFYKIIEEIEDNGQNRYNQNSTDGRHHFNQDMFDSTYDLIDTKDSIYQMADDDIIREIEDANLKEESNPLDKENYVNHPLLTLLKIPMIREFKTIYKTFSSFYLKVRSFDKSYRNDITEFEKTDPKKEKKEDRRDRIELLSRERLQDGKENFFEAILTYENQISQFNGMTIPIFVKLDRNDNPIYPKGRLTYSKYLTIRNTLKIIYDVALRNGNIYYSKPIPLYLYYDEAKHIGFNISQKGAIAFNMFYYPNTSTRVDVGIKKKAKNIPTNNLQIATQLIETMTHEITHFNYQSHNKDFIYAMGGILRTLGSSLYISDVDFICKKCKEVGKIKEKRIEISSDSISLLDRYHLHCDKCYEDISLKETKEYDFVENYSRAINFLKENLTEPDLNERMDRVSLLLELVDEIREYDLFNPIV